MQVQSGKLYEKPCALRQNTQKTCLIAQKRMRAQFCALVPINVSKETLLPTGGGRERGFLLYRFPENYIYESGHVGNSDAAVSVRVKLALVFHNAALEDVRCPTCCNVGIAGAIRNGEDASVFDAIEGI